MLAGVVGVPQFGGDPQVFAPARAGAEYVAKRQADVGFVAVVARAVEVAIADLDGILHGLGGSLSRYFPAAETDRGELVAAGELEGRSSHEERGAKVGSREPDGTLAADNLTTET